MSLDLDDEGWWSLVYSDGAKTRMTGDEGEAKRFLAVIDRAWGQEEVLDLEGAKTIAEEMLLNARSTIPVKYMESLRKTAKGAAAE